MNEPKQQTNLTPKPTPLQSRSYFGSLNLSHTPASNSLLYVPHEERLNPEYEGVIYGTNISVNHTIAQIQRFLTNFQVSIEKDDEIISEKIYLAKLRDIQINQSHTTAEVCFDVDADHLSRFSKNMYMQLIYFPVQMISCFDLVLHSLYQKYFIQPETNEQTILFKNRKKQELRVGVINLAAKDRICLKDLAPKYLGRLVSMRGLIIRTSDIYPQMKSAHFKCIHCKQQITIVLQNARVQQPKTCGKCRKYNTLQLIHNQCQFTNKQYIKFQQLLQNVSEGHTPASITIISYDSNVDRMRPGDIIQMTGIYRCNPIPVNRNKGNYRQLFNTYFDLISFQMMEDKSKRIKVNQHNFSDQQKRQFYKMANKQTVIDDLIRSFAPSIYGHQEIKKGILAQLFGGSKKDSIKSRVFRSQINICLVGDPSTAKSQMLQQVHKIAPRSIYTCGRGSSAVGLTANVRRDPQTREFVLESGALVLSDQGICCIDQFDKMDPNTKTVLLQVMEQQTISIAKAGIVCQLNSRTAILAAANPIHSKYDIKKSVVQNIDLPPSLLSRFDLLYILLDIPDSEQDKRIAIHILDIYSNKSTNKMRTGVYTMQKLANYISFAKDTQSILSEAAGKKLQSEYMRLRSIGQSNKTITATPRLLQSLIRLSQAFAKMRLSTEVTALDVQEAINLINFATLKSATDPETGIIDLDIISTGRSSLLKKRFEDIAGNVKKLLVANESRYSTSITIQKFEQEYQKIYPKETATKEEITEALKILASEDFIYLYAQDKKRLKFKLQQFNEK